MPDRETIGRPGALTVRPLLPEDAPDCEAIARSLPAWFGIEEGLRALRHAAESEPGFVAITGDGNDQMLGFVTVAQRFPETSEIAWMAVAPGAHHRGIGRALVAAAERHAREAGAHLLLVKTLADRHPTEEWDPANPCLLLGKPLTVRLTPDDDLDATTP